MLLKRLLLLCALLPNSAGATTWYVSNQGSDSNSGLSASQSFAALQRAAFATAAGDTVLVATGTYATPCRGCVVMRVTTSGTAAAPITYAAAPGAHPVIDFSHAGIGIEIDAQYITVQGFELAGGARSVTLAYAQAHAKDQNDFHTSANGIVVDNFVTGEIPSHVVIAYNVVHDAPGAGISICYADYVTVAYNQVYRNAFWSPFGGSGISLWEMRDTDTATGYKNYVVGNVARANQQKIPTYVTGIVSDGNGIIIDDNRNTQTTGIAYHGRTYVANNIVSMNGGSGVHAYFSQHVDIVDNTAYLNNQTTALNEGQIFAYAGSDVNILNNIGFAPPGKVFTSAVLNDATVVSDYNDWFSTTPSAGENAVVLGAHDIVANPHFVHAAANNFRLAAGSRAIGSGTSLLAPTADIAGTPLPTAAGYNRGAFDNVPSTATPSP